MGDFGVSDHGSICLLHPHTEAAREWIEQNVADDAQFFGNALAVERRYIGALIAGMESDGLMFAKEYAQ